MDIRKIAITDVSTAFPVVLSGKERREIRRRYSYGLTFALSGEIVYTLNKTEYVSDPDHLLLLPKGQSYSLRCTAGGLFPVVNFEIAPAQSFSHILVFPLKRELNLQTLFQQLEAHAKKNDAANRLDRLSLLYRLLAQATIPAEERHVTPKRLVLQPAVEYLLGHYDDPQLNNTLLAQKSYISEVYFRKIFKEEFGLSPKQYIQQIRINKARELLQSEYLTVTTISEMVGYSNIYHFSKAFKAQTGHTPTAYMNKDG